MILNNPSALCSLKFQMSFHFHPNKMHQNVFLRAACPALFLLSLMACSEDNLAPTPAKEEVATTFRANYLPSVDDATSRTTLASDKRTVEWEAGDAVSLFGINDVTNNKFVAQSAAQSSLIEGSMAVAADYVGVYPYAPTNAYRAGVITTTLPTQQVAIDDNMPKASNISVATTVGQDSKNELSFNNVNALLKVKYKLGDAFAGKRISKIMLIGNATAAGTLPVLSDTIMVTLPTGAGTYTTTVKPSGKHYISLAKETGNLSEDVYYYMSVPATTLANGYELHFITDDQQECVRKYTRSMTFAANRIYPVSLTLNSFKSTILRNVPLIKATRAAFTTEEDGTVDIYKADNLEKLLGVKNIVSNTTAGVVGLTSFDELPYYKNVQVITMTAEPNIAGALDFTQNKSLTSVSLQSTKLTTVDVSNLPNLSTLYLNSNTALTSVNTTGATNLANYTARISTTLTAVDLSTNPNLISINFEGSTGLTALNLSAQTKLQGIRINSTKIAAIDVSKQPDLVTLVASTNTSLQSLDVSHNTKLTTLEVGSTSISALDVQNNVNLTTLKCNKCKLTALDVSKNVLLKVLDVSANTIPVLDIHTIQYNFSGDSSLSVQQNAGTTIRLKLSQAQMDVLSAVNKAASTQEVVN